MSTRGKASAHEQNSDVQTQDPDAERRVRMTLRVSHDSGRTWGRLMEVREDENLVILDDPGSFPPCGCPHCTVRSPRVGASPRGES